MSSSAIRHRHAGDIRDTLGFKRWRIAVICHPCASYLLATWQDALSVAAELGNSVDILMRHHREPVRKEGAERFWLWVELFDEEAAEEHRVPDCQNPAAFIPPLTRLKLSYRKDSDETELEALRAHRRPALLVVDETARRAETKWQNNLVFELLNLPYADVTDTILNCNMTVPEFEVSLGPSLRQPHRRMRLAVVSDAEGFLIHNHLGCIYKAKSEVLTNEFCIEQLNTYGGRRNVEKLAQRLEETRSECGSTRHSYCSLEGIGIRKPLRRPDSTASCRKRVSKLTIGHASVYRLDEALKEDRP